MLIEPSDRRILWSLEPQKPTDIQGELRVWDPTADFEKLVNWDNIRPWLGGAYQYPCPPSLVVEGEPVNKFRVIDVLGFCVVPAPKICEYMTLGYVWGGGRELTRNYQATLANMKDFETPGFLKTIELPNTIADALQACARLGTRYLWVDALCIVQDDTENKEHQINHMDQIYRDAVLCIVAAAGLNASYGLPGVSQGREFLADMTLAIQLHDKQLTSIITNASHIIQRSKWCQRVWTFQEEQLSKRLLYFTDFGAFYVGPEKKNFNSPQTAWSTKVSPAWSSYHKRNKDTFKSLVKDYTARELFYHEDILRACSGVLRHKYKDATAYGIPFAWFDDGMLWNTRDFEAPSRVPDESSLFPSWSWTSVLGSIEIGAGYGVAWWSTVSPESESHLERSPAAFAGKVTRSSDRSQPMISGAHKPRCRITYMPSGCDPRYLRTTSSLTLVLAWDLGCIEKKLVPRRWGTYQEYWNDAFGPYVSRSPFSDAEKEAALGPGRLLVYTQEASLKVEWIDKIDPGCPGKQYLSIPGEDGSLVGFAYVSRHRRERLPPKLRAARFIALSVGEKTMSLGGPLEGARVDMMNIMLVHNVSDPTKENLVQRIAIGQIYLEKWGKAERKFKALILE